MDLLEAHFTSELGCEPDLIKLKRAKMASGILDFYRGSADTFYSLWSRAGAQYAPAGWICGDAHWENVGSYKGKNHVSYFDFTDFDHGCLCTLDFDIGRATTCLYLLRMGGMAGPFLAAYRKELAGGKPYHIEEEVARGTVARLLVGVRNRSQRKFIRKKARNGRLLIDGEETYAISIREKRQAKTIFERWAKGMKHPAFFEVLDICGSYSGLGILGHRRYLVLVKGHKAPHLIDMKPASTSQAAAFSRAKQPPWSNEAERIAEIQRIVQYMPIARLGWTRGSGASFVLSEYQPAEDRVDSLALSKREYRDFAQQWGKLLAWSHLRGGGWKGAATTSQLIEFASTFDAVRRRRVQARARSVAAKLERLFLEFRRLVGTEGN